MDKLREIFYIFLGISTMLVENVFASEEKTLVAEAVANNKSDVYIQALSQNYYP